MKINPPSPLIEPFRGRLLILSLRERKLFCSLPFKGRVRACPCRY